MDSFQKLTMCDSRFGEKTKFVSWFRLLLPAGDILGAVIHPAFLLLEGHSCGTPRTPWALGLEEPQKQPPCIWSNPTGLTTPTAFDDPRSVRFVQC